MHQKLLFALSVHNYKPDRPRRGWCVFRTEHEAESAILGMNGLKIDGHILAVVRANVNRAK
uniref:RRM domain-containing protein n=1 Tax=Meloidogyne hapla TaxID=6305 RepID=A0A1I8B4A7_MELHA